MRPNGAPPPAATCAQQQERRRDPNKTISTAPRLDPVAPVLTTLAQALHIQNTAASPLLEPRLKATLGVHRSSSVARRDAQPAELQEHPSQLSLAEKRQDWRKRRREVQLSKLFQADKRQDWRKRRQKPWRLNLYSVIPSGLIPSGLIPSGCSDDDDDDDDDDDNYGDDTDLSCAHIHGDEVPPCKPPSTASKRGRDATKPPLTSLYPGHGGAKHRSDN